MDSKSVEQLKSNGYKICVSFPNSTPNNDLPLNTLLFDPLNSNVITFCSSPAIIYASWENVTNDSVISVRTQICSM